jgi:WD40 repeat protein
MKPSGRSDLDAMVREMQMKAGGGPAEAAEPSGGEGGPGGGKEGREGEGEKMEEGSEDEDEDDDSDEDDNDNGMGKLVPCSHEALLKGHTKAVTTIALDPSGSRLLTGSADSTVKFWDFNGMTAALKNFREITPWEGQSVTSLAYSNSGDKFLCATTKNQCTLYTRDGIKEVEFVKGDMYVHDMAQTKGHVAALVSTRWDPKDKGKCLTAAIDGTVRLWDLETCNKKQLTVIKCKNLRGQKATPYSACYAPNGDIVAGCDDGTIKIWDAKAVARGSTQKAHNEAKEAHQVGQEITGLSVSSDGINVVSRCRDETLKIWDMRKMNSALASFTGLENLFDQTGCGFSPNNNLFFTGTSVRKGKDGVLQGEGQLHVYDRQTLQPVRTLGFPDGSVVSCLWHPRINQMMVGSSSGATHAMYDPRQSEGGVMRSVGKMAKKADITQVF